MIMHYFVHHELVKCSTYTLDRKHSTGILHIRSSQTLSCNQAAANWGKKNDQLDCS